MRVAALALLGLVVPAAAGCGSASEPSPPTGVDGLVVPTPSLDPADFVDGVDNPWLPLEPGSRWEYRVTSAGPIDLVTATVPAQTREVQGVAATVVRTVVHHDQDGAVVERSDWYAQDSAGNVWLLGADVVRYRRHGVSTDGSWEAGVDGAQAGLAMLASPRVGDGYQVADEPGVVEDRARVVALDAAAQVPYGDLTGLLETEDTTPLDPDAAQRRLYARGIGLVRAETLATGELVELVEHTP